MKDPGAAVLAPRNVLPRIEKVWAYLSRDEEGNEALCAGNFGPDGMMVPLIAADEARLKSLTPLAEHIAAVTGIGVVLVEFTGRVDLREITGRTDG